MQIRSVRAAGHHQILSLLAGAGLIDANASVEAVRNIVVAPEIALSDTGRSAVETAGHRLAAAIEALIEETEALHLLPEKFGAAIFPGGDCIDSAVTSDITFVVDASRIYMLLGEVRDRAVSFTTVKEAADGFKRTCLAFLRLRREKIEARRIKDALGLLGVANFARAAGLVLAPCDVSLKHVGAPVGLRGRMFGIAFVFGEAGADAVSSIAEFAEARRIPEIAVTPHRALVLPGDAAPEAEFAALAHRIGAIVDPGDPRLRVHACTGAPGCPEATVAARQDAKNLVATLMESKHSKVTYHISGCAKRCAYARPADIIAVGRDGVYDVTGPGQKILHGVAGNALPFAVGGLARGE